MTNETATMILALAGALLTWTVTVVAVMGWIYKQFSDQRTMFFIESRRLETKYDAIIAKFSEEAQESEGRIQRLELMVGGSTLSRAPLDQLLPGHPAKWP